MAKEGGQDGQYRIPERNKVNSGNTGPMGPVRRVAGEGGSGSQYKFLGITCSDRQSGNAGGGSMQSSNKSR